MSRIAPMTPLRQRSPAIVSSAIRQSAKGEACALRLGCCNCDPSTTVLAHLRFFGWAGISEKPHDYLAVYACSACHDAIDGRSSWPWGYEDLLRALGETQTKLFRKGLLIIGDRND